MPNYYLEVSESLQTAFDQFLLDDMENIITSALKHSTQPGVDSA